MVHGSNALHLAQGLLMGLALTAPLFGPLLGLPSVLFAGLFAAIACGLTLFEAVRLGLSVSGASLAVWLLTVIFLAMIVLAAHPEQYAVLFSPGRWGVDDYIAAKLTTILLHTAPLIAAALPIALLSPSEDRLRGICIGMVIVSMVAILRVFIEYAPLAHGNVGTANSYFTGAARGQYSLVSYGILCVTGAAASLALRKMWPLTVLFLFAAFWTNRRTETLLIVALLLGSFVFRVKSLHSPWKREIVRPAVVLALVIAAAIPLHNYINEYAWSSILTTGIEERVDLATGALDVSENQQASQTQEAPAVVSSADAPSSGLGSYAARGGAQSYPHDILIEALIEIGPASLAVLLFTFLATAVIFFRTAFFKPANIQWVSLCGLLFALFIISLKAGDLSSFGRIAFLMMIAARPIVSENGYDRPA